MLTYLLFICVAASFGHQHEYYINEFAIELSGGFEVAKRVASELNLIYLGPVTPLADVYIFGHPKLPTRHKRAAVEQSHRIREHSLILWAEQQQAKIRVKRNMLRFKRNIYDSDQRIKEKKAYTELADSINDPFWPKQAWYMRDAHQTPQNSRLTAKADLRILPVWLKGYTGKGVVISILDDGLEWNHTDIQQNYAAEASYDLNDDDSDPFPRYDPTNENRHGTRCAGVIAMTSKNNICGVGIAPDAKVGGVRMLDGSVTDRVEAQAIAFNVKNIDIMSASWGPSDNGRTVDGPGRLGLMAFDKGISEGRNGLGVVYIWASGNGGSRGDNCECDGYVSSPFTISISSASVHMKSPFYVEKCPSTMATTFSSGEYRDSQVVSIDLHNKCTESFTGTSAAAPQAAAIVALTLEANPKLTWRDIQHLIVWTASPYSLYNNPGWKTNAAGFKVNHRFGFGLLNAIDMVNAAEDWENVGVRKKCDITASKGLPKSITPGNMSTILFNVQNCKEVNFLEHVELIFTASYSKRGDISIDLISAQGTRVSLMRPRENDYSSVGYTNWPFMSVQTWGENPTGTWKLIVWDDQNNNQNKGAIKAVTLRLWGTTEMPSIMANATGHRKAYNFELAQFINEREKAYKASRPKEEESSESLLNIFSNMVHSG